MTNHSRYNKNPNWKGGRLIACEFCGKLHWRTPARLKVNHYYCSIKCRISDIPNIEHKRKGKYVICGICHKQFYALPGQINERKFCSYECTNKSFEKENSKTVLHCAFCGKEYIRYVSYLKIRESKYCSKNCHDKASELKTGELSSTWKGGISTENRRIRSSAKWARWRDLVFKRDNYTCMNCGDRSAKNNPVELHPHHKKSFKDFPELRFDPDNGITLCVKCHHKIHSKNATVHKKLSEVL